MHSVPQVVRPDWQTHLPSSQLLPAAHSWSHPPQCAALLLRETQLVPHRTCPVGQSLESVALLSSAVPAVPPGELPASPVFPPGAPPPSGPSPPMPASDPAAPPLGVGSLSYSGRTQLPAQTAATPMLAQRRGATVNQRGIRTSPPNQQHRHRATATYAR